MRIFKLLVAALLLSLISKAGSAAPPTYAKPINAYQKKYDMSFFVWKPIGMHSKWYATYDGYPVTEIAENQWVYGVIGSAGHLSESLTAVGSVDPNTVHIFTPLSSFLNENSFNKENKFTKSLNSIFNTKCNSFSIAYTKVSDTPIAWKSGTSKVFMWGGKRWVTISARHGEKLSDTIKRDSYTVANMLKTCKITWTQLDTFEFANYIKSMGYNWIESFETNMPYAFNEISYKTGGADYTGKSSSERGNPDNSDNTGNGGSGGWDTGKDP